MSAGRLGRPIAHRPCAVLTLVAMWAGALAIASPASAQLDRRTPQILIGVSLASIEFKDQTALGVDWRPGLAFGVGLPVPIGQHSPVSFHPEVLYVQKGATVIASVEEHIRTSYLQANVGIQLDVLPVIAGDRRILLDVAPTLSVNLTAASEVAGHVTNMRDSVERFDAGVMIGARTSIVKDKLDLGVEFNESLRGLFRDSGDARNRSLLIFVTAQLFKY